MSTKTLIFGHRGYPFKFPENSLKGFQYAIDHGIDGLEFDVHLTKDNVPVIMHDEKINRTTDGKGLINSYTLKELQQFHMRDGETIPTLKNLLALAVHRLVHLNLEFKTNKIHYPKIEQIVLDLVKQYDLMYPVIYSSFNLDSLKIAYQIDPNQQYCLLSDHVIKNPKSLIVKEHLAGLHLSHYQPLANVDERIWTVDDPRTQEKLLSDHVAGIITDNFEQAVRIKNRAVAI
ncbi:glycerophosphodiester phosphodiesterase [Lentilactobacillus buchneri]|uniref:glycerophosphodiester phosphodiesterase n=1 Tax=Lentilactobacillus buchneri TaxID=1581 RepID=UPI0012921770|nr:glycerophosphodiester phosphodiesterase family protein [Lentilactobacillus buchneri]MQN24891.1 glycerophosphodiester phosphodiesterase [Lentilactobacillus buchneri]